MEKCHALNCQKKHSCYRYTIPSNPEGQHFIFPTTTLVNGVFSCSSFVGIPEPYSEALRNIIKRLNK